MKQSKTTHADVITQFLKDMRGEPLLLAELQSACQKAGLAPGMTLPWLVNMETDGLVVASQLNGDTAYSWAMVEGATPEAPWSTPVADVVEEDEQSASFLTMPYSMPILPELDEDLSPEAANRAITTVDKVVESIGIILPPFDSNSSVALVRDAAARADQELRRVGAILLRQRLSMTGAEFSGWLFQSNFGFSRTFAYNSMAAVRALVEVPEIKALTDKVQSSKKLEIITRNLRRPEVKSAFLETGLFMGMTPEDFQAATKRQLEDLENKHKEATLKLEELALANKTQSEELGKAHRELSIIRNPELAPGEIDKTYLKDVESVIQSVSSRLEVIRPSRRGDLNAIDASTIHKVYASIIYALKHINLVAREMEATWSGALPELLSDESGNAHTPASRSELRILDREVGSDYQAVRGAMDGRPFSIVPHDVKE